MDRRLIDHFVNSDIVSRTAMQRMILLAQRDRSSVIATLVDSGAVEEADVTEVLSRHYDYPVMEMGELDADELALKFISEEMAAEHGVLPFALNETADEISIAVFDPELAEDVIESLETATGNAPDVHLAPRSWLRAAIAHYYFDEPWSNPMSADDSGDEAADTAKPNGEGQAGVILEPDESEAEEVQDESSEIVLDNVVAEPDSSDADVEEPPGRPKKPKRPKKKRRKRQKKSKSGPPKEEGDEVEQALEDFDAFLDGGGSGGGLGGGFSLSNLDDEEEEDQLAATRMNSNLPPGFGNVSDDEAVPGNQSGGPFAGIEPRRPAGFDLLEGEADDAELEELVRQHRHAIEKLSKDLERQREVIQAMADLLSDAGILSTRQLKAQMKKNE